MHCGCGEGIEKILEKPQGSSRAPSARVPSGSQPSGTQRSGSVSQVMGSLSGLNITGENNNAIQAYYYQSQMKTEEFKIFKWGNGLINSYSCRQCGAQWVLQWDKRSSMGTTMSTVELVGGDDDDAKMETVKVQVPKPKVDRTKLEEYTELDTLQIWKVVPTHCLHTSMEPSYTCWDCECVWVRQ